jgi:UDP-glucose 6-dehydrogenase
LGGFDGKCVPKDTAALSSVDSDPNSILKILEERGSKEAVDLRILNQMTDE